LIGPRQVVIYLCLAVVVSWTLLIHPFSKGNPNSVIKAAIGLALIGGTCIWLGPIIVFRGTVLVELLCDMAVLVAYGLVLFVLSRLGQGFLRPSRKPAANQRQVLLLLPFCYLLTGSMSSGGYPHGLCGPIAFLFLLLPLVFPAVFERGWFRSSFFVLTGLMAISGMTWKVWDPISWNNY